MYCAAEETYWPLVRPTICMISQHHLRAVAIEYVRGALSPKPPGYGRTGRLTQESAAEGPGPWPALHQLERGDGCAPLSHQRDHLWHLSAPVVFCTGSQAALATRREGPATQKTSMGAAVWTGLAVLFRQFHLQLVPSHSGIDGNKRADQAAKEPRARASSAEVAPLPQATVPGDVGTAHRAAIRLARHCATAAWPDSWCQFLMGGGGLPAAASGCGVPSIGCRSLPASYGPVVGLPPVSSLYRTEPY